MNGLLAVGLVQGTSDYRRSWGSCKVDGKSSNCSPANKLTTKVNNKPAIAISI